MSDSVVVYNHLTPLLQVPLPTTAPIGVFSEATGTLYVYGGMVLVEELGYWMVETSSRLYALDVHRREWRLLSPGGECPPPSEKGTGWEYEGDIWIFGGYSQSMVISRGSEDSYEVAEDHHSGGGWTNSLVRYSPKENRYHRPVTKGRPPCPRAGSASCVQGLKVFIFGGRCRQRRLNDLHCLDLETLTWSQLEAGTQPDPWAPASSLCPAPRSLHTMVTGSQRLIVYGGLGQLCAPLNDCWVLEVSDDDDHTWRELELDYDHGEVRCWHTASVTRDQEMVIMSGLTQEYYLTRMDLDDHPEDVLHLNFGPQSLLRLTLEAVVSKLEISEHFHDLECLPRQLSEAVLCRIRDVEAVTASKYPSEDTQYSRSRLHAGL